MIFTKPLFEKLCAAYKFEVNDNVARYLGYAVVLYFPGTGNVSVWLGSEEGFTYADDYNDAIKKVEKCIAYIAKSELEYKKAMTKERIRKMGQDFV